MKKIGFSLTLIFISFYAFCQGPVNIGIKFGTSSSTMITDVDEVLNQRTQETDTLHYLAGIFVRVNLGRLYLQPEAYFNTKGGMINTYGNDQFQIPNATFDYQTIDIPVLFGIKLIKRDLINLRLHAGPVFSYVTANDLISDIPNLDRNDLNDRYVGWQVGAGLDVWFLTLDARVETSSNILGPSSVYEARNRLYLLSAGIKLF